MDSTIKRGDSKFDSTSLYQRRAIEQTLCEEIYKNLLMMMKIRQPTEDLKSVMNKEMFLKSNPKAFIHVMHFILTFIDDKEFTKRFYWPIHDKKTENSFRTSMVEYLNVLNVKYSLGFEMIKMHIVVMPGGTKFMRILHALVKLTMKQYIKLKTKGAVQTETTNEECLIAKVNETVSKICQLKEDGFVEKIKIDKEIAFKKSKIAEGKIQIDKIMAKSSIKTNDISAYIGEKCSELKKQIPDIKKDMENTSKIISELEKLSETVESYINDKNENIIKFNEEEFKTSLQLLKYNNVLVDKNIDFSQLIFIVRDLGYPIETIINKLSNEHFDHLKANEAVTKKILQDCKKNKLQLTEMEHLLCNIKIDIENNHLDGEGTADFKDRLIQTPPIRFSIIEKNLIIKNPRLALMDIKFDRIHSKNQILPFTLCDKNRSINRSLRNDKMDPISVLKQITRTAKKQSNKSITNEKNLSILASKWKDREQMMYGNLTPTNISSSTIVSECEYEKREGVFKMNSPARIFTEQIIETTKTTTPDSIIYSRSSRTNSVIRMDFKKSPLGKLTPLVDSIPRIMLNDGSESPKTAIKHQEIKKNLWLDTSIPDINFDDDESINNISDTILIDLVDDSP